MALSLTDGARVLKGAAAGLVALIGVSATTVLLTDIPLEESGRTVEASVSAEGDVAFRHIDGKQYLQAYLDIAGVPTACDGITKGVKLGQSYTEAECAVLLIGEIEQKARGVMACSPALARPGMDHQIVAAIDFSFNLGVAAWCGSTAHRWLEAGDLQRSADNLLSWNKARVGARNVASYRRRGESCARSSSGVWRCTVRGLTNRRQREREYMLTGTPGFPASSLAVRLRRWR